MTLLKTAAERGREPERFGERSGEGTPDGLKEGAGQRMRSAVAGTGKMCYHEGRKT